MKRGFFSFLLFCSVVIALGFSCRLSWPAVFFLFKPVLNITPWLLLCVELGLGLLLWDFGITYLDQGLIGEVRRVGKDR